ncbi:MAG: M42 family metallopeptidase [Ruminococcaceae bacterium]|jgi:endoglucanase|nr:M42 family metallopeptidase [Oscillospiraceae bacterium]
MIFDNEKKAAFKTTLKDLLQVSSPSGKERVMTDHIKAIVEPYAESVQYDNYGNLMVKVGGSGKKLMLCAHTDELGYWIRSISDDGFLHATNVRVPDKCVEARQVLVDGHIPGVVGTKAAHLQTPEERRQLVGPRDIFIDVGATSREEAEAMGIHIGSYASHVNNYMELANPDFICCRALDDRAGCTVLIELLKNIDKSKLTYELWLAFTLQEEVGLRGATAAVSWLEPDCMIAVDTVPCADTPGMNWKRDLPAQLGHGCVCSISEGMAPMNFIHPDMEKKIFSLKDKYDIPLQPLSVCGFSASTDTLGASIHGRGVSGATLTIPRRYSHSPVELMHINDALAMLELLTHFVTE